jgi:hypothetical protein
MMKGKYIKDLQELVISQFWRYCKAQTLTEITEQRLKLTTLLAKPDVEYILNFWRLKERQFLPFYTEKYANLGCYSNQRSESTYVIIKKTLYPQLRLSEATARLNQTIRRKLRDLADNEIKNQKLPRTLDRRAFAQLADTVTNAAIKKIALEWEQTK